MSATETAAAVAALVSALDAAVGDGLDASRALDRRVAASYDAVAGVLEVWDAALAQAWKHTYLDLHRLSTFGVKAAEAAEEEARARTAQLSAYAMILEASAAEGEEEGDRLASLACVLLACDFDGAQGLATLLRVTWDDLSICDALADALWLRDGVAAGLCEATGAGLLAFHADGNAFALDVMDASGARIDTIEASDVSVCVTGGTLTRVAVTGPGCVLITYDVAVGREAPVRLSVSVCGSVLPASPWLVPPPLADSDVVAGLHPDGRASFLASLMTTWLPGGRAYSLLYRGTRDGLTAAQFHKRCDDMGPTLVLVKSDNGSVFGGYAGASWDSRMWGKEVACSTAFVFSVSLQGAKGSVVLFPLKRGQEGKAMWCRSDTGPVFPGGFQLGSRASASPFDDRGSYCDISFGAYEDVLKRRGACLTGALDGCFKPVQVEVFGVRGGRP